MDPVTICAIIIAIIIVVICTVIFKLATKETSFEEAYGQSARGLLIEDKNSKTKPKLKKPAKIVDLNQKNKVNTQDKDVSKNENKVESKETTKENVIQDDPVKLINSSPETNLKVDKINDDNTDDNSKKIKKKNKRPESGNNETNQQTLLNAENDDMVNSKTIRNWKLNKTAVEPNISPPQLVTTNASAPPPKQKKKNVANASPSEIIEYLKSLENVEPAYITAISRCLDTQNSKEAKLSENNLLLKKEQAEMDRSLQHMTNEVRHYQDESAKFKADLKAQQNKYEVFESTIRGKLAESIQLKEENKRLAHLANQAAHKDVRIEQLLQELKAFQSELAQVKKNSAMTISTGALRQIEKLQLENTELTKAYREVAGAKTSIENELSDLKHSHELLKNKEHELQVAQKHMIEMSKELDRASTICAELKNSQQEFISNRASILNEINAWKSKCASVEQQLAQITSKNDHYKNQINHLEKSTTISQEKYQEELAALHAKLQEELALQKEQLEADNQKLMAQAKLTSSGNINNDADLKAQLDNKEKRNEDLRAANYKLLEVVKEFEVKMEGQVSIKELIDITREYLEKSFPQLCTPKTNAQVQNSKDFADWILTYFNNMLANMRINKSPSQTEEIECIEKSNSAQIKVEQRINELQNQVAHYSHALEILKERLILIEKAADEVNNLTNTKISPHKKHLEKHEYVLSPKATSGSEDWEVITD